MNTPDPQYHPLFQHLNLCRDAYLLCAKRIATPGSGLSDRTTQGADTYLFIVSAYNFLKAFRKLPKISNLYSPEVQNISARHKDDLIKFANWRNILEHMDDYAIGRGNLQEYTTDSRPEDTHDIILSYYRVGRDGFSSVFDIGGFGKIEINPAVISKVLDSIYAEINNMLSTIDASQKNTASLAKR